MMNRFSAISCFCVLLVIAESRALTLSEAFPWINTGSPPIGQGLQEFEAQFPDATSRTEQPMTDIAKQNQEFTLPTEGNFRSWVNFINGNVAFLSISITKGDIGQIARTYRNKLHKLYGEPSILQTGQINEEGVVHPIVIEEYEIAGANNFYAMLFATSKGLSLRLVDKAAYEDNGRKLVVPIEDVRKSVERFGGTSDGEKTITDHVAKLRAEEAGETTGVSTSAAGDVVAEEDIASNTAPSESSPAPSAKKKFPTPLQIGIAFAVIILLVIVFAAKMRRSN